MPVTPRVRARNRATCTACQISKRKCDLNKPSCSRCIAKKIECVPSKQARWKMMGPSHDGNAPETTELDRPSIAPAPTRPSVNEIQTAGFVYEMSHDQIHAPSLDNLDHEALTGANFDFMTSDGQDAGDDISNVWEDLFQTLNPTGQSSQQGNPNSVGPHMNTTMTSGNSMPQTPTVPASEKQASTSPETVLTRYIPPQIFSDTVTPYLWNTFVTEIVAELTPSGNGQGNPLLRYLAARAREEPGLFASVLFLSQKVIENRTASSTAYNKNGLQALGVALEQQAMQFLNAQTVAPDSDLLVLGQLSTMITLCTAYISEGSATKLEMYLENALILVQSVFKKLQSNETFLFLIKWLGYIHASAMLSNGKYNIRAPDYISISKIGQALETGGNAQNAAPLSLRGNLLSEDVPAIFLDIDDFLGISTALLALMYKLGRLYRMRHAAASNMENSQWFWQDFQAEADDLNTRIEQQLSLAERPATVDKPSDLDNYNNAFLLTLKLVFQFDVRGVPPSNREGEEIVGEILDFCAAIPLESVVAKLCALPLFQAGMRSTRRLHREFVQTRLTALMNYFLVVNVAQALEILSNRWASGGKEQAAMSPHVGNICVLF